MVVGKWEDADSVLSMQVARLPCCGVGGLPRFLPGAVGVEVRVGGGGGGGGDVVSE